MYKTKEELALKAIKHFIDKKEIIEITPNEVPDEWKENGAVFVTLKIKGTLRGCIGSLKSSWMGRTRR